MGRERPGRPEETASADAGLDEGAEEPQEAQDAQDAEADDGGAENPDASESAQEPAQATPAPPAHRPVRQTVTHAAAPTEPVLRILPLGSGLVLIGLGLGLAFIGLRLRRT